MMLSEALGLPFFDADEFHPSSNIEKMASGIPLDDEDRMPWLEKLAGELPGWEKQGGAVLACSALKETYRGILASHCNESIRWVFLVGSEDLLAKRLAARKGHFYDPGLLASQLAALELPLYGWRIDIDSSKREIVNNILERLHSE